MRASLSRCSISRDSLVVKSSCLVVEAPAYYGKANRKLADERLLFRCEILCIDLRAAACDNALAGHLGEAVVGCIGDDFQQLLDIPAPDGGDNTELGEIDAD